MNWIDTNVHHLIVPLGMFLGVTGAVIGFYTQHKRKQGVRGPVFSEATRNWIFVMIIVCALVGGFAIAKTI